jgi:transposase
VVGVDVGLSSFATLSDGGKKIVIGQGVR